MKIAEIGIRQEGDDLYVQLIQRLKLSLLSIMSIIFENTNNDIVVGNKTHQKLSLFRFFEVMVYFFISD